MSEYRVGRIARSVSKGCGHSGIFLLEKKLRKGEEPSFLGGSNRPTWMCRKLAYAPQGEDEGCPKSSPPPGSVIYFYEFELELFKDWKRGDKVILEDGREGILQNPRGCYCGPNGEPCWDIATSSTTGVQAHGGTWKRKE